MGVAWSLASYLGLVTSACAAAAMALWLLNDRQRRGLAAMACAAALGIAAAWCFTVAAFGPGGWAGEGVLVVVLARGSRPVIEAIGLPLDEDLPAFLAEAAEDVLKAIGKLKGRDAKDEATIREAARLAARRAAQRWSGKRPQVRVVMPGVAS